MWTSAGLLVIFLLNTFGLDSQNTTTSAYTSYTAPSVNLSSCLNEVAVLEISNLQSGGLIYIRTRTGIHKLEESFDTNGDVYTYQCDFNVCGIEWFNKFTFVSQRHAIIQTAYDLHQTFICLADLISIMPGGGSTSDENAGDAVQHTYRATANMRFLNTEGTELESGSFVRLGTHIDIYINLTNNIGDMFDLSVKSCSALLLPLISDRCPSDDDLFGQFTKLSTGLLYNNFSMFRPTSTQAGAMDVLFSCTLEICRTPCSTYYCNGTEAILVSQNETSRRKRQAQSRSLKLGTVFRVDYEEPVIEEQDKKCAGTTPVAVFTSLALVLSASLVLMLYYITEWKRKQQSKNESTKIPTEKSVDKNSIQEEFVKREIIIRPSKLLMDINREICGNVDLNTVNITPSNNLKSCLKTKPKCFNTSMKTETNGTNADTVKGIPGGQAKVPHVVPMSTNAQGNFKVQTDNQTPQKFNGLRNASCPGSIYRPYGPVKGNSNDLAKQTTPTKTCGPTKVVCSGSTNQNPLTKENVSFKKERTNQTPSNGPNEPFKSALSPPTNQQSPTIHNKQVIGHKLATQNTTIRSNGRDSGKSTGNVSSEQYLERGNVQQNKKDHVSRIETSGGATPNQYAIKQQVVVKQPAQPYVSTNTCDSPGITKSLAKEPCLERGHIHHNKKDHVSNIEICDGNTPTQSATNQQVMVKQPAIQSVSANESVSFNSPSITSINNKERANPAILQRSMSQAIAREIITLRTRSSSSPKRDYVARSNQT